MLAFAIKNGQILSGLPSKRQDYLSKKEGNWAII